ncbi:MAG: hypothetical protein HOV96_22090 [Nonomuraea sp.]|nr:hypothetical protein [Nonomuraea sp.]NUP80235.1 hypothetical protein [Nonomuraea sp.]NUR89269.1 hypothetical protein [Nonomuraea sp.]NUS04661.1 hypothetical protein [Nonomuraea sp.]NUT42681.1 hypothetical protein [Thermoactinospora sp.]
MSLIDRECVRQLLESKDPDATLVFVRGDCVVLPAAEIDDAHKGLVIATREDVASGLGDGAAPSDQALDDLAVRLDNVVRDLGA